ncbi:E3 ubiquitin-protein ligase MIEL1-like [Iris pallida]|uniref:E3 ubiquitin-protein ligase MIEL1-like n=1 Tax=Iris pallida TaxID=29817 RepID=A0AAX6ED34_IRIPA|nr:E3 ubiquitin-protein ligase MIEL1-like [Iris pallida]
MGAMSNHPESLDGGKRVKQIGIIHHDAVVTTSCSNSLESISGDCTSASTGDTGNASGASASERLEKGHLQYGCSHYRRRCRIRAPCCNEIFDCRHCHNEAKNSMDVESLHRHDIPRHELQLVICSLCGTEQEVRQACINCGVSMGKYFCETCKFFDDDTSKQNYHCNGCGICRTGGQENSFHCYKCGCCYSITLKDSHLCVEGAMHHYCPVCFEYLFESTTDVTVLPCGHTIHVNCLKEMQHHLQYACPLCSKSVCDMSKVWEKLDKAIAATPMPELYSNKMVGILCNDCGAHSNVPFHVVGQKCPICRSYNTRQK